MSKRPTPMTKEKRNLWREYMILMSATQKLFIQGNELATKFNNSVIHGDLINVNVYGREIQTLNIVIQDSKKATTQLEKELGFQNEKVFLN